MDAAIKKSVNLKDRSNKTIKIEIHRDKTNVQYTQQTQQQQNNILIANGTIKSGLIIFVIQISEEDERDKIF